jgi:hypothetical protein
MSTECAVAAVGANVAGTGTGVRGELALQLPLQVVQGGAGRVQGTDGTHTNRHNTNRYRGAQGHQEEDSVRAMNAGGAAVLLQPWSLFS